MENVVKKALNQVLKAHVRAHQLGQDNAQNGYGNQHSQQYPQQGASLTDFGGVLPDGGGPAPKIPKGKGEKAPDHIKGHPVVRLPGKQRPGQGHGPVHRHPQQEQYLDHPVSAVADAEGAPQAAPQGAAQHHGKPEPALPAYGDFLPLGIAKDGSPIEQGKHAHAQAAPPPKHLPAEQQITDHKEDQRENPVPFVCLKGLFRRLCGRNPRFCLPLFPCSGGIGGDGPLGRRRLLRVLGRGILRGRLPTLGRLGLFLFRLPPGGCSPDRVPCLADILLFIHVSFLPLVQS